MKRSSLGSRLVGVVVAVTCCGFVGHALARQWTLARHALAGADLLWLAGGLTAAAGGMVVLGLVWASALHLLGADAGWAMAVTTFFRGELGKYVPGGPWAVVGRSEMVTRTGVRRAVGYGSVVLSLLAGYVACALVAIALLPVGLDLDRSRAVLWVVPVALAGLVLLHPAPWRVGLRVLGRQSDLDVPPPWRQTALLVIRAVPAWLLVGSATWCAARALHADVGFLRVLFATAVSWLGGVLAVPVPSGVGVREAIFIAVAGPLPAGIAAAVAVTARLVFVVTDVIGAAVSTLVARRGKR